LLSFISMIAIGGVVVGVSALIVVMGVMNGLQRDLREKILVASPDVRVLPYGEDLKLNEWRDVLVKVKATPGVVAAAPFVITQGLISAGHAYSEGAYLIGIEPQTRDVEDVTAIRQHAIHGDFRFASSDGRTRGVVIGKLLAGRLNAYPGDTITMLTQGGISASIGTAMPRPRHFEVTGIFETGMYQYDNGYVYMSLAAAQEAAGLGDAATGIEVKTRDRWSASIVGDTIEQRLGSTYRSDDWQEQNSALFQAFKLEKLGMGIILLLIILVAAFNIVSNLTMVVADKTKEIGILKAMGMTARSIRRVFVAQGLVIGVAGTMLGLVLGLAVAIAVGEYKLIPLNPEVYLIDHLPAATDVADVVWTVLASIAIATAATLYPSNQAAKLFPVEAIRHE
jgi:lipoprotein-releasing system permease protein